MYSFWAMYSLRMSFWSVPRSFARGMPRFSAAAMYIAQITGAGLLIVIEVVILSSGMPSKQDLHVGQRETATPHLPNSPSAHGSSVS